MKKMNTKILSSALISLLLSLSLMGQRPIRYESPEYDFNLAIELMQKEQYGAASQHFKEIFEDTRAEDEVRINSYYYMGVCAVILEHSDADFLLTNYIRKYPVHSNVKSARFYLGKFYFGQKKYKQSLAQFNEIDERDVPQEALTEYRFKKGYDYFVSKDGENDAKTLFAAVRKDTVDNRYLQQTIYYSAYIAYSNGQYESALQDFLLLKDVPAYQGAVPFYIAQIYFLQKEYEEAVNIAVPLLDKAENPTEMSRIIALSYYNLGQYENAMNYFEKVIADAKGQQSRDDEYAIGFTYYENKQYENAVNHLALVTRESDSLAQNAYYIIGDCYLQLGNYNLSMQSFLEASKYDFSEEIKEDALYNYAKLQYETSGNAFNSAIKALEQYVNTYPHTARGEEATAYLSDIYMSTKNYQGAINSLDKISSKSPALLKAYQRCTHYRALELVNNKDYKGALKLIEKSMGYPLNASINTSNLYWKAECEYRNEEYLKSYYSFQSYYKKAEAGKDENYQNAYYSYGYAALKAKKYQESETAFKNYLKAPANDEMEADALARLADCHFMRKDLDNALSYYEKCVEKHSKNFDYALLQEAKCLGYQNKIDKKMEALERLQVECQRSMYLDDAEYEIACTYHTQGDYAMAIISYNNFIDRHPKSPYIRQAYNKLAQAYLNTQDIDNAINKFKYVFEHYQGTVEAKDALDNLQIIYAENGTMGEFFAYIKNKGNIDIKLEEQDSLTFKAALTKYNRGDCEAAIKGFNDYIRNFPQGFFIVEAYNNKAECEYGMKDFAAALSDYEALLKNKNSALYNETALRRSAIILYNNKEYEKALTRFTQLSEVASSANDLILAHSGIMRAAYEVKKHPAAKKSAEFLLLQETTDDELRTEARYIAGKSAYTLGDFAIAKKHLAPLAKSSTSDISAEAAYINALIEFKQNNLAECEKLINEILSANYSSEYWYASTFILYGDWYLEKGNVFQAKHTYQSIVDNYEGDDLREIAQQKIDKIVAAEQEEMKNEEQQNELENTNE